MAYGVLGSDEHPAATRLSAETMAKATDARKRSGNRSLDATIRISTDQVSNHLLVLAYAKVKNKAVQ
jgi:hypothetical protein